MVVVVVVVMVVVVVVVRALRRQCGLCDAQSHKVQATIRENTQFGCQCGIILGFYFHCT